MSEPLKVKKMHPKATLPTRSHTGDAGLDLYWTGDGGALTLRPGQGHLMGTGVAVEVPVGFVGIIADRSSCAKMGLKTAGGVVDSGYRGEIKVIVWNICHEDIALNPSDRVAQLLVFPVATPAVKEVQGFDDTDRGMEGFGSSGK